LRTARWYKASFRWICCICSGHLNRSKTYSSIVALYSKLSGSLLAAQIRRIGNESYFVRFVFKHSSVFRFSDQVDAVL